MRPLKKLTLDKIFLSTHANQPNRN